MVLDMFHNINYINLRNDLVNTLYILGFLLYILFRSFYFSGSIFFGVMFCLAGFFTYLVYDMYRYIDRHIRENSLDELEY